MSCHSKESLGKTITTRESFSYSVLSHEDARKITESFMGIFFFYQNGRTKIEKKRKQQGGRMKNFDCYKSIGKCPRSERCSAQLCLLDPEVEERVYLEGGPTCRLNFDRLTAIADDGFKEQYRRFTRVSLNKEARFKPLNQTAVRRKSVQKTST